MTRPLAPWSSNLTVPAILANSVSSLPRELAELVAIATKPLAAALRASLRLEQLERANAGQEHLVERCLLGDDAREASIHGLLEIDVAGVAHEDEHRGRLREARGERLQQLAPAVPDAAPGRGRP